MNFRMGDFLRCGDKMTEKRPPPRGIGSSFHIYVLTFPLPPGTVGAAAIKKDLFRTTRALEKKSIRCLSPHLEIVDFELRHPDFHFGVGRRVGALDLAGHVVAFSRQKVAPLPDDLGSDRWH